MPFLGKTPTKLLDANVNIDGGNIDGTTIGATSAAAATVTTFTSTGIDDNATSTAITIDASENVSINTTSQYGSNRLNVNGGVAIDGRNATTPGLCEKGDTNTGIFWPTTDTLGVSTGGAERMRIDSSGDVGIGVAPAFTAGGSRKLLQIANSTNGAQIAMSNSSSESENPRIFSDSTNLGFATAATGSGMFQFYTAGTERMRIDSSGNLLVGRTSTPSGIQAGSLCIGFDIHHQDAAGNDRLLYDRSANLLGNTGTSGAFYSVGIGTDSLWSDAKLTVDNGGSGAVSIALSRSGAGQNDVALVNDAGEFIIKSGAASTVAGLTEHMRVDASGRIMQGNTSGGFITFNTGQNSVSSGNTQQTNLFDRVTSATTATGTVYVSCENAGQNVMFSYIIDFFYSNNTLTTTARETGNSQGTTTCTVQANGTAISVSVAYAGGLGGNIRFNAGGHASVCNY